MRSLESKAHFWGPFVSPNALRYSNPMQGAPQPSSNRPQGLSQASGFIPTLKRPTPLPSHHPQGRLVGLYSRCTSAVTAQCWEWGSLELSITVHVSLLALKACWLVEQNVSKKETLVLVVLHSACGDSRGSAVSSQTGKRRGASHPMARDRPSPSSTIPLHHLTAASPPGEQERLKSSFFTRSRAFGCRSSPGPCDGLI